MQKFAKKLGGKCLSKEYINANTKLEWKCEKGHVWKSKPAHVKDDHWCKKCANKAITDKQKNTIEDMKILAKEKNGKCLSTLYINGKTNLLWQCKLGHEWKANPTDIKQGQWCPICSQGIGERITRKYFETIFNEKFPKIKPNWLINSKGNKMELDGYSKKLGIAFEYQGHQHYIEVKHYHQKRSLKQQIIDDKLKKKLCKKKNILLIDVPLQM